MSVRMSVNQLSISLSYYLVITTFPLKPQTGLSSYFQGMFPQILLYASSHYFYNMSVRLSVNQLSISLSYFQKKLVTLTPPTPLNELSLNFVGIFLRIPNCALSTYFCLLLLNSYAN